MIQVAVFGYLLAGFISVFHSSNAIYSFSYFAIYSSIVLVAYHAVRQCRSEQEYLHQIFQVGLVILILAITSFLFTYNSGSWIMTAGSFRYRGLYLHPVSFGNLLALLIIIGIGYATHKRGSSMLAGILILPLLLYQIVLSGSRTPVIALAATISYTFILTYHFRDRNRAPSMIRSASIIGLITVAPFTIILWGRDFFLFIIREQYDTFWMLTGRVLMWRAALEELGRHPILGSGFAMAGNIVVSSGVYINPEIIENPVFGVGGITHLHNAWFQATLQTNILGTVFFSGLVILLIHKLYLMFRVKLMSHSNTLTFLVAGLLFFFFINMTVASMPALGRDITLLLFYLVLFGIDKFMLPVEEQQTRGSRTTVPQPATGQSLK